MRSVAFELVFDAAQAKRRVHRTKSKDAGDRQGTSEDEKDKAPAVRIQRTVHGVTHVVHAQQDDGHGQSDQAIHDAHVFFMGVVDVRTKPTSQTDSSRGYRFLAKADSAHGNKGFFDMLNVQGGCRGIC